MFRFFKRKHVVSSLKSDRIKLRIFRGSVFDLSHMSQLFYPHRAQISAFLKKFEVFFNDFSKGIPRESYGGYGMDAHALHVHVFRFFKRKNVVPSLKSDRIKLRIHRGSVFDLSHMIQAFRGIMPA